MRQMNYNPHKMVLAKWERRSRDEALSQPSLYLGTSLEHHMTLARRALLECYVCGAEWRSAAIPAHCPICDAMKREHPDVQAQRLDEYLWSIGRVGHA